MEVNGSAIGTFRIVHYIMGVRFSGVSVKWGSTILDFVQLQPCLKSPERGQYSITLVHMPLWFCDNHNNCNDYLEEWPAASLNMYYGKSVMLVVLILYKPRGTKATWIVCGNRGRPM